MRRRAEKQLLDLGEPGAAFLTGAAASGVSTLHREITQQIRTPQAARGDAALVAAEQAPPERLRDEP